MVDKGSCAGELFVSGYNCAQSVFLAFSDDLGFEQAQAARLSNVFGGGLAGSGGICGAVSGACMAISTKYGRWLPERQGEQLTRQTTTYRLGRELQAEFTQQFGSVLCSELLEKGFAASGESQNEKHLCPQYVRVAAELANLSLQSGSND